MFGHGNRGFRGRWIIAAIIALVGVASYYMRTEVNPVTGEKQHIALSVDQEIQLGLQSAPRMAYEMGGAASNSDPEAQLVKRVGMRVYENSDARKSPYRFNFHLVNDSKTINAFALPGGQIFITRALLNKLSTEAELAGVLGHEIGHVINRHAAEHMAKGQLGQMLAGAAGVAASDDRNRGVQAAMAAQMVNQMFQLKYSRGDEIESDEYGLKYMAQAGYDPRAMLGVIKVLAEIGKSRQIEMLQTHPQPERRLESIEAYLKKTYPNGIPSALTMGAPLNHPVEVERPDFRIVR